MSAWNNYLARMDVHGNTKREHALKQTQSNVIRKAASSLSYKEVLINGSPQAITILSQRGDLTTKRICSMPGESLLHGGLVGYSNNKWLITEIDADSEIYSIGYMRRCNYLLKWLNRDGQIIERWCVVEDGTKYLIGEKAKELMTIGDARIAITIGKDSDTNELSRGRRFLVDDLDSEAVLAYQITKPNKLFNVYGGLGVFRFILNEVNLTDDDNVELRIADYYSWKPHQKLANEHEDKDMSLDEVVSGANAGNSIGSEGVWL